MISPKISPSTHTPIPNSSNLCPSIPPFKNRTDERSGNRKLASPPGSSLPCANAPGANIAAPPTSATSAAIPRSLAALNMLPRRPAHKRPLAISFPSRFPSPISRNVLINPPSTAFLHPNVEFRPSKFLMNSTKVFPAHQFVRRISSSRRGSKPHRTFPQLPEQFPIQGRDFTAKSTLNPSDTSTVRRNPAYSAHTPINWMLYNTYPPPGQT